MPDCGSCGMDVAKCSCDYGVIENANEEQSSKPGHACCGSRKIDSWNSEEGGKGIRKRAAWEKREGATGTEKEKMNETKTCKECEFFDSVYGDCLGPSSPRCQTEQESPICEGFYPSSTDWVIICRK